MLKSVLRDSRLEDLADVTSPYPLILSYSVRQRRSGLGYPIAQILLASRGVTIYPRDVLNAPLHQSVSADYLHHQELIQPLLMTIANGLATLSVSNYIRSDRLAYLG